MDEQTNKENEPAMNERANQQSLDKQSQINKTANKQ
jgi:hypothetical protein